MITYTYPQVRRIIDNYKSSNRNIGSKCRQISEMLLVKLDGKRVYESNEFEMEQQQHRQGIQKKLQGLHKEIITTMKRTFEVRYIQWNPQNTAFLSTTSK